MLRVDPAGIRNIFIAAVRGQAQALCPVEKALATQRFIQAAYLSHWERRLLLLPPCPARFTVELQKRMRI